MPAYTSPCSESLSMYMYSTKCLKSVLPVSASRSVCYCIIRLSLAIAASPLDAELVCMEYSKYTDMAELKSLVICKLHGFLTLGFAYLLLHNDTLRFHFNS